MRTDSALLALAAAVVRVHAHDHAQARRDADAANPLANTNPTAVPIASFKSGIVYDLTTAPFATQTLGAVPTYMPAGVPGLADVTNVWSGSPQYPTPDVPPDVTHPLVQQWIAEVKATGVQIANLSLTDATAGCGGANAAAAADPSRCWWTCGGCTRSSDVSECPKAGQWGLTYDDGPAEYSSNLMEYLAQQKLQATLFVVGSRILEHPKLLQEQYMAGHQIAVHTWSHHYLTSMSNEEVIAELGWSRKIIKDVLGVTPNFMRPPFGDIDDRVRNISMAMGLYPVMWTRINATMTFDTSDYNVPGGKATPQDVVGNWSMIMTNVSTRSTGFIVLEHDLFEQTVELATGYILPDALARTNPKLDIMPISQCLGLPLTDAYVETNDNKTHPSALAAVLGTAAPSGPSSPSGPGGSSSSNSSSSTGNSTSGSGTSGSGTTGGGTPSGTNPAPTTSAGSGGKSAAPRAAAFSPLALGVAAVGVLLASASSLC